MSRQSFNMCKAKTKLCIFVQYATGLERSILNLYAPHRFFLFVFLLITYVICNKFWHFTHRNPRNPTAYAQSRNV